MNILFFKGQQFAIGQNHISVDNLKNALLLGGSKGCKKLLYKELDAVSREGVNCGLCLYIRPLSILSLAIVVSSTKGSLVFVESSCQGRDSGTIALNFCQH